MHTSSDQRTGGSLLADSLHRLGLTTVFALHGGHLDAFLVECADHGVTLLDTRHEASAGHAADAYARVTGEPGVSVTTSGPGFLNTVTAIGNAYLDRVPMIAIVGAPPLRETETNPLQGGIDQIAVAAPMTKWSYRVTHPWRIPEILALAVAKAKGGVPGPVLLEIPIDVLFDTAPVTEVRFPAVGTVASGGHAAPAQVEQIAQALSEAQRPLIVAGGGVSFPRAQEELRALAEALQIPVLTPNKSEGVIPSSSPLHAGGLSTLLACVAAGQAPDVVLVLGQRQGMFTGGRASLFPGARVFQVDQDAAEIGRIADVELGVVADSRAVLVQLAEALVGRPTAGERAAWLEQVQTGRAAHAAQFADSTTQSGRMHPYHAAKAVVDAAPNGSTFVLDGAENASWASYHVTSENAGDVLRLGYLGCLGIGPGFAIGAHSATGRPTVVITGDGAAGFNLQEFDTMVRHGLPIVTVVFNNTVWGMSVHGQEAVYGERGVVVSELADTDYHEVCAALGGYGERVRTLEEIPAAMRRALDSGLPACLNLEIDPDVVHPTTLRMLGDVDAEDEVVIPYYQNFRKQA
ncbi:thiamine pyrophosphate-binding protein [Brevibacterium salitolerans]|uniref:Thiamine pyrophosphate-binding protein n=1 Tax=Brevibacterium salitolerans TaxID=1403566 RepID=A0ABN2WFG6_9MICO